MTANNGTLYNYECSDGLILPIVNEFTWAKEARATLYFFGLLYCFLGISIIADIFMCSIEKIISKTRKIYMASATENEPEVIEVRIWSDTVANLTLMALGSSAPEILLSCIEIVGNKFEAGELGPGTIVGSAAFNLLCIVAICIISVPKGEVRTVKYMKVFACTTFFSFLAYIWLLVILVGSWSPDQVEIWEAAVTFAFFPLMVLLSWAAERNFFREAPADKQIELGRFKPADKFSRDIQYFKDGELNKDALVSFVREVKKMNPKISDEDAAVLAAQKLVDSQHHSRLWYRIGATRSIAGGRKTTPNMSMKLQQVYTTLNEHPDAPTLGEVKVVDTTENAVIEFHAATAHVMENVGKFDVTVVRSGLTDTEVRCRIETIDGTATVNEDYIGINEILTFQPGEIEKQVTVEIINDNQWEPDEEFFLKVSLLPEDKEPVGVEIGRISIMEITILNDDEPGNVQFSKRGYLVNESIGKASIPVIRKNGADGEISVKWKTIDRSALSGKDYEGGEGMLIFKHTETERILEIPITNDFCPEKDEHFEIELFDPTGGARIGRINRTAVTIISDDNFNTVISRLMNLTNANIHAVEIQRQTWGEQIKEALTVNGGDVENATNMDYVMHFLTFFWKVLFSLVPPTGMLGGWPCFFVSLGVTGVVTAIVGDLASIFGCLVGLRDSVTAISFVALGTSLPDTFASRTAAIKETYADMAIGNITGSNSVNVFLGLGLPWLIASIYHAVASEDGTFKVERGALAFSVAMYTGCAIVCVSLLVARRYLKVFGNGELGGPTVPRYASGIFVFMLWILYLVMSSLQAYGHLPGMG
ncbi:sodium/calcium exchanger 2-like [Amphibalanus amphitrite]|uniref:sodium/calcium exchanger 2-like n=1 Tax=Amphibalanus amphitrite TaxID=1232801 RepID=UPI001C905315|nr:sodium/calcium exchanger 2-like [Amphibalanus amphitrite]